MHELTPLVEGNLAYKIGEFPCMGNAYMLNTSETEAALRGKVAYKHHSVKQRAELKKELSELADTGFEANGLESSLVSLVGMEPWRIGETFAECWLEDNRHCIFPWNTQSDLRSLKASLPGTDLVGIALLQKESQFAFGEVKSSSDAKTPPSVMYGEKGLTFQLKNLRQSKRQRQQLIQNLGFRAIGQKWIEDYRSAFKAHLSEKYSYWGLLIRDTMPSDRDLTFSVKEHMHDMDYDASVEFVALYCDLNLNEWPALCKDGDTI